MNWGHPDLLHLMWALLPVAWLTWWLTRRRQRGLEKITHPAMVGALTRHASPAHARWRLLLWLTALALLSLFIARPQWGEKL